MKYKVLLILIISGIFFNCFANEQPKYIEFIAKKGDKVELIFKKYNLPKTQRKFVAFINLNKRKTNKELKLMSGLKYKLPIIVVERKNLTKTLKQFVSEDSANRIQTLIINYNKSLSQKGIKTEQSEIWIPLHFLEDEIEVSRKENQVQSESKKHKSNLNPKLFKPYYGKIKNVKKRTNHLKDFVFYLVSGHGGPDPGAIGYFEGKELHEDEYAYDITLRLAKHLEENGGKVYMITIDTVDGIRDDRILETSNREVFYGGVQIPANQRDRLELCANILNDLYKKESKNKSKKHISINIHLDSRSEEEKVDVFYYYQENNLESKILAETLQQTFAEQYEKYQPGRGYFGTIETRNLFMLRNSLPTTVYIELGNIRNKSNQYRFVEKNNREAISKWLCLGLIKFSRLMRDGKATKSK